MRDKLVDDAGDWWRWWSMQINMVATAVLTWVAAQPESAMAMLTALPTPLRIAAVILFGALVAFTRLYKQEAKSDEPTA